MINGRELDAPATAWRTMSLPLKLLCVLASVEERGRSKVGILMACKQVWAPLTLTQFVHEPPNSILYRAMLDKYTRQLRKGPEPAWHCVQGLAVSTAPSEDGPVTR
jgi:hypothetical protein